ncbi:MAG: flap endonuclease-1 [Candidatus Bathyarchaeota archaeon]|nr:flap endonuclease-1 [Candidatus Bathyarchaeota archaeon]
MGVLLTPIINKKTLTLDDLKGKSFAVDGYIVLHQFLALIRARDGTPLMDKEGRVTSHLVGLAFRTTRLISDYSMKLVFVFDGKPPALKQREIMKRREAKEKAEQEYAEAIARGDVAEAFSKAVMTGKLTRERVNDTKRLLTYLGIPWVQAPSEGEAQAAHMARQGDVWASNSKDYDSLLFGAPRLVRYLTISGQEWLPSKGIARKLQPELFILDEFLKEHQITREQLIDLSILMGTDFNDGIKGVGPKTALKLIKKHGSIEDLPDDVLEKVPDHYPQVREVFLNPDVTSDYDVTQGEFMEDELKTFLCDERNFSPDRVNTIIRRMRNVSSQKSLTDYFGGT